MANSNYQYSKPNGFGIAIHLLIHFTFGIACQVKDERKSN